jgi:hypothetical protein
MNPGKVTAYVLISLLVLLILVVIILALIQVEDEHEFIKDVKKIKLHNNNELIIAGCDVYKKCHAKPTGTDKDNAKYWCDLPMGLQALYRLLRVHDITIPLIERTYSKEELPPNACDGVDSDVIDSIKTTFSFSHLEAKQIYNNNNLVIDNVYNNKDAKKCFRAFIQVVGPDLGKFIDCYSTLDTRRQKYINIIITALLSVAGLQMIGLPDSTQAHRKI